MENMGHTGLIKMKIKFTQHPNVFCDAKYIHTHTHIQMQFMWGRSKLDMIA